MAEIINKLEKISKNLKKSGATIFASNLNDALQLPFE